MSVGFLPRRELESAPHRPRLGFGEIEDHEDLGTAEPPTSMSPVAFIAGTPSTFGDELSGGVGRRLRGLCDLSTSGLGDLGVCVGMSKHGHVGAMTTGKR